MSAGGHNYLLGPEFSGAANKTADAWVRRISLQARCHLWLTLQLNEAGHWTSPIRLGQGVKERHNDGIGVERCTIYGTECSIHHWEWVRHRRVCHYIMSGLPRKTLRKGRQLVKISRPGNPLRSRAQLIVLHSFTLSASHCTPPGALPQGKLIPCPSRRCRGGRRWSDCRLNR